MRALIGVFLAVVALGLLWFRHNARAAMPSQYNNVVTQRVYLSSEDINQKYDTLAADALKIYLAGDPTPARLQELRDKIKSYNIRREKELAAIRGEDYTPPPPPAPASAPAPPAPAPAPAPPVVPSPGQTVTGQERFQTLKDGTVDGVWEFQLNATEPWKTLPNIVVSDDNVVEFSATGIVCGGPIVGCVGPNGQFGPAKLSTSNAGEFPVGEAFALALVARIGSDTFQVGDHKTYEVPAGTGLSIDLMDNYRLPYIALASGGFRVKITIRKK